MKTKIILSSVAIATLLIFSCNSGEKKETTGTETITETPEPTAKVTYACPMHPEIKSETPAKCSECGMDLEVVK